MRISFQTDFDNAQEQTYFIGDCQTWLQLRPQTAVERGLGCFFPSRADALFVSQGIATGCSITKQV